MAETMQPLAEEGGPLLKALSNSRRLMIVCQLVDRERSVGPLAHDLGEREALVSQHLAVLRRERIVIARRSGQSISTPFPIPQRRRWLKRSADICAPPACTVLSQVN